MKQLQAMIVAAVAPLQAEIAAIKEVVDQDTEDLAEADEEEDEEEENEDDRETLQDSAKRSVNAAGASSDLIGENSKRGRTNRTGPY